MNGFIQITLNGQQQNVTGLNIDANGNIFIFGNTNNLVNATAWPVGTKYQAELILAIKQVMQNASQGI